MYLVGRHANRGCCDRSDAFVIYSEKEGEESNQNLFFEQQFSMLLTAQNANKNVEAWLHSCTADGKFPMATIITLK